MIEADKLLIGSEEWCAFPELGIPAIKARVDSGAKTSALHAVNLHTFKRGGETWVNFEVHPLQKNRRMLVRCEAKVVARRSVKSSSGASEKRTVIRTPLTLGAITFEAELTLTNRDSMGYRMLLGREAMVGRAVVDPAQDLLLGEINAADLARRYAHLQGPPAPGLHIALISQKSDDTNVARLIEAGEERGHRMTVIDPMHYCLRMDADTPEIHSDASGFMKKPDAVIARLTPQTLHHGATLLRQMQLLGVLCVNEANAICAASDPLQSLQLLLQQGLDTPITVFASGAVDIEDFTQLVGGPPLLVRLANANGEETVVRADSTAAAKGVIAAFKTLKVDVMVQEAVEEAGGRVLRLVVLDGRLLTAVELIDGDHRKGNDAESARVVRPSRDELRLALRAAAAQELLLAAVDVVQASRGPLVVSVDPMPDLDHLEQVSNRELASSVIAAIEKRLQWPLVTHATADVSI